VKETQATRSLSFETRRRIGDKLRGTVHTEASRNHMSQAHKGIRELVYPFFLRLVGTNEEIAQIARADRKKIDILGNNLRQGGDLSSLSQDKKRQKISKAIKNKWEVEKRGGYTKEQTMEFEFAHRLFKEGFFTFDLTYWNRLGTLWEQKGRSTIEESFANLLRLEVFYKACVDAGAEDTSLLNKYGKIGRSVDKEWFNTSLQEEEKRIAYTLDGGDRINAIARREVQQWMNTVASWRARPPLDPQDVVQEVSKKLLSPRNIMRFPFNSSGQMGFIFTLVINCIRGEVRKLKRYRKVVAAIDRGEMEISIEESDDEEYRRIIEDPTIPVEVKLRVFGSNTDREIAQITGQPLGTVKSRIFNWRHEQIAAMEKEGKERI